MYYLRLVIGTRPVIVHRLLQYRYLAHWILNQAAVINVFLSPERLISLIWFEKSFRCHDSWKSGGCRLAGRLLYRSKVFSGYLLRASIRHRKSIKPCKNLFILVVFNSIIGYLIFQHFLLLCKNICSVIAFLVWLRHCLVQNRRKGLSGNILYTYKYYITSLLFVIYRTVFNINFA